MMRNRIAQFDPTFAPGAGMASAKRRVQPHGVLQSLRFAMQGLRDAWVSQPNLRVHVYLGMAVVAFGIWVHLTVLEWIWISFAIGLVVFAELMNTAIEQTVDLVVGLRRDPVARQVKDIAAGCVLAAIAIAIVIGVLTFGPHLVTR